MQRFLTDPWPSSAPLSTVKFYREEFLKHRRCLQQQREYYSEDALCEAEAALTRILAKLEQLCLQDDAEQVVSDLLRRFDVVTGLSAWTDPKHVH
jgi:hypothetical protein